MTANRSLPIPSIGASSRRRRSPTSERKATNTSQNRQKSYANRRRLEPIIERYLSDCYARHTVARTSELAHFLDANRPHLSEIVREAFGKPLSVLLRERQLARAAWLLTFTAEPVDEVGAASGFGHRSTFYRVFRQAFQISPGKYRLANRPDAT